MHGLSVNSLKSLESAYSYFNLKDPNDIASIIKKKAPKGILKNTRGST